MEPCLILAKILSYHKTTPNQPTVASKDRVLFNLQQKNLTQKFVKTEILVTHPKNNKTVEGKPLNLTREIEKM